MNEALTLARMFGWHVIEARKGKLFMRKNGSRCPFLVRIVPSEVCYLQEIGLKPKACKLWPFHVFKNPEYGRGEEAAFSSKYGTFYVYVDARCPGVTLGRPSDLLMSTVIEALEIWLGVRAEQHLTTSTLAVPGHRSPGSTLRER